MIGRVEREFKLRIPGEAAWQALLARLGGPVAPPVLQINHFFDTTDQALRQAHIALRLRVELGRFTLALKGPVIGDNPALAARPEEELEIEAPLARVLLDGKRSPLDVFRASTLERSAIVRTAIEVAARAPVRCLGDFENERTRVGPLAFPPGSGGPPLVFELDRTRFPGGRVDLELELELPPDASPEAVERELRALLSGLGIPAEPMPSKAARFFGAVDPLAQGR